MAAGGAVSLMLYHLGELEAAGHMMQALEAVAAAGAVRTPDLGGRHTTTDVANAIAASIGGTDEPAVYPPQTAAR